MQSHTADRGDVGVRLDLVVRRHLDGVRAATRTRVQSWIREGLVQLNGTAVRRVSVRASLGDVVTVEVPPEHLPKASGMEPEDVALSVMYEDDHIIVINKPAGVVVHPTYRHASGTLLNALLWRARDWPTAQRPSIVGRLDQGTSGLVIGAKSADAHARLQRTLLRPDSEKLYLAVVHGRVRPAGGTIDLRVARDGGDRRRMVASVDVGARSLTHFERLDCAGGLSLLCCRIVTGRTHQIRVHLAARGWPIYGDLKYAGAARPAPHEFSRPALHAWRTSFIHPVTGQAMRLDAPPPPDFAALLAAADLSLCA